MPNNAEFGQRAREARRRWAMTHDAELTYEEIGAAVAASMGRDKPYSHQAVRRWFADGQEPDSFAATTALAAVLDCDVAWLAFGVGTRTAEPLPGAYDSPVHADGTPRVHVTDPSDTVEVRSAARPKKGKSADGGTKSA